MKQLNHGIRTWQNYLQQQKTIDFYEQDESKKNRCHRNASK